jgi:hypothetical protein
MLMGCRVGVGLGVTVGVRVGASVGEAVGCRAGALVSLGKFVEARGSWANAVPFGRAAGGPPSPAKVVCPQATVANINTGARLRKSRPDKLLDFLTTCGTVITDLLGS